MGFEVDKVPVPLNGYYQKKKKKSSAFSGGRNEQPAQKPPKHKAFSEVYV